jgi:DNA topoisomerase I
VALREFEAFDSNAKAKRNVRAAIERVASRLGNTPTICRKCYVHPEIVDAYVSGSLLLEVKEEVEQELRGDLDRLRPEEAAVLALLQKRLSQEGDKPKTSATPRR